ncbi:hypothetical protein [Halpernia sp. GG3]
MVKKLFLAGAILVSILSFTQKGAGHQNIHIKNHGRVGKINSIIDNQEKRITEERKEGDLSKQQAVADRKDLRIINTEKQNMRKDDHGHLTKADDRRLNRQLNQNSKSIGN